MIDQVLMRSALHHGVRDGLSASASLHDHLYDLDRVAAFVASYITEKRGHGVSVMMACPLPPQFDPKPLSRNEALEASIAGKHVIRTLADGQPQRVFLQALYPEYEAVDGPFTAAIAPAKSLQHISHTKLFLERN